MENKSTDKNEMNTRITTILQLLVVGMSSTDIYLYVEKKTTWEVDRRTVRNYIKKARIIIEEKTDNKQSYYINRGIRRYDDLYKNMYKTQDFKGCLTAQEKLEKLLGLSLKNDVPISTNDTGEIVIK